MFKLAKYYVLLNLYQNAKGNVLTVFVSIVFFIVAIFLFGDLMAIADGNKKYAFVLAKWIVLLSILIVIVWNIRIAFKRVRHPLQCEHTVEKVDKRKEKLLAKHQLQNREGLIFEKYKNMG